MAQAISRSPDEALERGHQLIRFLRGYPTGGLFFPKDVPQFAGSRTPRVSPVLESFTDASFAPDGSRSQQSVQIYLDGSLVAWTSTRKAFVTMSTAESELVCICEGVTALKSLEGLTAELMVGKVEAIEAVKKVVYTDSQAALAVCKTAAGTWRTRHLRIRGNLLRELLDLPSWQAYHLEGDMMVANIGTKGLNADRFFYLLKLMGLNRPSCSSTPAPTTRTPEQVKRLIAVLMMMALMPQVAATQDFSGMAPYGAQESGLIYVQSRQSDYWFVGMALMVVCLWEHEGHGWILHQRVQEEEATRQLPTQAASSSSSDSDSPPLAAGAVVRQRRPRPSALDRA